MTCTLLTIPADRIATRHPSVTPNKDAPKILTCDQCASSMDLAWELLTARKIHTWDSVTATEQTAGRGQYRRRWISPRGNLHAAWVLPHPSHGNHATAYQENLLPLVAAYMIVHGLALLGVDIQIKWPNDLLCNTRKIGGILVEQRDGTIIVGIGINVASAPTLPSAGAETVMAATCLAQEGFDLSPADIWCHLVESGIRCFDMLIKHLPVSEFIHLITHRLAWRGKQVQILENGKDVSRAIVMGVAEDGGLLVNKNARVQTIHSGRILTVE